MPFDLRRRVYKKPVAILACTFCLCLPMVLLAGMLGPGGTRWASYLTFGLIVAGIYFANRALKAASAQADCDELIDETTRKRTLLTDGEPDA